VIFGAITSDAIMATLAVDGEYTPPGEGSALPVRVVLRRDVERISETAITRQTEATFRRSVNPRRGALLVIGDEWWRVGEVQKDNGHLVVVSLRPYQPPVPAPDPEPDDE
jgi:hypothetical protein